MPVAVLKIVPASVELKPGESQAFEALDSTGTPVSDVTWFVVPQDEADTSPGPGTPGATTLARGVYVATYPFFRTRRLAVVAQQRDPNSNAEIGRGSAAINLDPIGSWTQVLGAWWVALFLILLIGLVQSWSFMCLQCAPKGLFVTPPIVTLTKGQAQQFVTNAAATWTNTVNSAGLYVAPTAIDSEQMVNVTATSKSDPQQSSMGVVRLTPTAGLTVLPSSVMLRPEKTVKLTAVASGSTPAKVEWLPPAVGTIDPDGTYKAPPEDQGAPPRTVIVMAQAQIAGVGTTPASTLTAGSLVTLVRAQPDPCDGTDSSFWRLIFLVAWVGALGGLTHAMSSFGTYVGNRELKTSWLWWYGLKPVLSSLVAVLVFLVFRAGFGAPDLGLATGDCLRVAGFAGLVGLFAEQATVKLKDIFEAILTPKKDPREDKAGQDVGTTLPQIDQIDPAKIKAGEASVVRITGKNFAEGCIVQIGAQQVPTRRLSSSALQVDIAAGTLKPGTPTLIVFNKPPNGGASKPASLAVE